jgi:CDP-glycerol glycerophosphotransferase
VRSPQDHSQPLISVVIPVRNVSRYLPDCLDSVLGKDPGIEVIAVDDASTDGSGALLDERRRADDRLTVIHAERAAGPGVARNLGLGRAAGRYIWFVDGDDLIPAGAFGAIIARLAETHPDVLLLGYENLFPDQKSAPGYGGAVLHSAPPGLFTLADAPQVIDLTMTAWSKLLRREFLIGLNEPFRTGIHEDIPVTCAALFTGQLCVLDRECYCYRRSRPGSFMATTSTDHFAVFSAYGEVFGMLRELTAKNDPVATPAVQAAVFERAIWHYASVLAATGPGIGPLGRPGLVPRRERRKFFERMHADFVRYAPADYRLPGGARGAKLALIKRDDYLTYELLEPLNRLRVSSRAALTRLRGHRDARRARPAGERP